MLMFPSWRSLAEYIDAGRSAMAGLSPPYDVSALVFPDGAPRCRTMAAYPTARHASRMPNYRRARVPGGTYFFTVNLLDRRRRLLVEHLGLLGEAFRETRRVRPFDLLAIVVLPDHLHCVWRLPEGDADNANRWAQIKSHVSRRLPKQEPCSQNRTSRRERGLWQRRYWEHLIRDEDDLRHHVDYVHLNPVKHGHVSRACDWRYSSFRRWAARGVYPWEWMGQ